MGEETVGLEKGHRRRSRAESEQLVGEYEASGLTRQAFCAERGVSVTSLDKYRRRHGDGSSAATGRMVAVELVTGLGKTAQTVAERSGALLVELRNGRRIAVGREFDATTLERLLTVLERV
jgi:hypothetical protein